MRVVHDKQQGVMVDPDGEEMQGTWFNGEPLLAEETAKTGGFY